MKFALIVVGMVALAVLFAGCTSQESNVNTVTNTAAPVTTDNNSIIVDGGTDSGHMYAEGPVVPLGDNSSYQLVGAEVQGCKIAVYINDAGVAGYRNAPENDPRVCPTNLVGRV